MLARCAFVGIGLALAARSQTSFVLPSDDGLPGVSGTHASQPLRPGLFLAGASGHFAGGADLLRDGVLTREADGRQVAEGKSDIHAGRIFLAAGLGAGWDASLFLPVYYQSLSGAGNPRHPWAAGDASAALKLRLPLRIPVASFSISASGSLPTSAHDGPTLPGQLAYHPASGRFPDPVTHGAGQDVPRGGLGAGLSLDFSQVPGAPDLKVHVHAAADRAFARERENPTGTLTASLAAEAALGKAFRLEGELRHQRLAVSAGGLGSPLGRASSLSLGIGALFGSAALRTGARIAPADWNPYLPLSARDATGTEVRLAYRPLPPLSAYLQIAWEGFPLKRDKDHDGVPDGADLCPSAAEDRDGFQDEDGCPDLDNDQDGVPDKADRCPYAAEDHDGFEDEDGCPEPDNDHDGIADAQDKCPNDPEDKDGVQDEDGCPDPDVAAKPMPEPDTDHDGIPDARDKCPREAEIINFYQDGDGCPDERPEPVSDGVLEGVGFQGNGAELDSAAFPVLEGLAARLSAYPGTEIEIQAFLDDRAGSRAKDLSQARAEAVAEYLSERGIEARRMKPVGYGSERPIQPNRTARGRAANRRIQIHRLN